MLYVCRAKMCTSETETSCLLVLFSLNGDDVLHDGGIRELNVSLNSSFWKWICRNGTLRERESERKRKGKIYTFNLPEIKNTERNKDSGIVHSWFAIQIYLYVDIFRCCIWNQFHVWNFVHSYVKPLFTKEALSHSFHMHLVWWNKQTKYNRKKNEQLLSLSRSFSLSSMCYETMD